jgi:peptide/nickel transport system permease protein
MRRPKVLLAFFAGRLRECRSMGKYILRRVALLLFTLFVLSILVFMLSEVLPGDIGRHMLGPFAPQSQVNELNHKLGYDRPLVERYASWLGNFVQGDWGESYLQETPVLGLIAGRMLNSFKLAAVAIVIVIPFSIIMGVLAGLHEGGFIDRTVTIFGLSLISLPEFVSGIILLILFTVYLHWFPSTATPPPGAGFWQTIYHLLLPAIPIMFVLFGYIARHARAGTMSVAESPYVRAAYLKGLPRRRIVTHHILRNALPGTVTVVALQAAFIIAGLAVIEVLFSYPGLGKLVLDSANGHDVPVLTASALVVGLIIMGINLIADILYAVLDPRVRLRGET